VATLANLLAEREPVYGKADVTVVSRDTVHDVIVGEIIAAICNRLGVAG
jgi:shikimate kinase